MVSRAKSKWYKPKTITKLALNSQLLTAQILTNDVHVLILCLSYFITTVISREIFWTTYVQKSLKTGCKVVSM